MFYDQILNRLGLDQGLSEVLIVVGAILLIVGFLIVLFWQYLVAGAVVYLVLTVFSHHVDPKKIEEVVVEKSVMTDKKTYMEECEDLTDKADVCEDLWKARDGIVLKGAEEVVKTLKKEIMTDKDAFMNVKEVKLLDVDNKEYKDRRADALKKPNAVIMQTTFSDHDR